MRFRHALTGAVLLAIGAALPAAEKEEEGFVPLFNGRSLDGWVVMGKQEGWQVRDGVIRSEGGRGGDWLRTEKEYGDFILRVDWRVSKNGNSGVFIRADKDGAPWVTGYEVQISNEPRDEKHCTGSLYGYAAVEPRPDEAHDVWHTFEIRCEGSKIQVKSDGVKCIDFDQRSLEATQDKPLRGFIGLQDSHSPPGHYIEFKNVRIKEL